MSQQFTTTPGAVFFVLRRYWMRWLLPAVALTGVSVLYALVRSDYWEATQGVMVRNEAGATADSPGKFRHDDEMKTTLETLLEVVLSRRVLFASLRDVGPPLDHPVEKNWPTETAVIELREALRLSPPNGAEFGKTEVFYLKLKDRQRERAVDLVQAVYRNLETSLGELRESKAESMVVELSKKVTLARADLEAATKRLAAMEQDVSGDLVELRMLHQSPAGDGDLNRTMIDAQNELRQIRLTQKVNEDLYRLIQAAKKDPQVLIAEPVELYESKPMLRRLKEGLVDSQLRTANLSANMTDQHPQVIEAKQAERLIHQKIFRELDTALRGVEADMKVAETRGKLLQEQLASLRERSSRLASVRAEYSNLANQVDHRRALLEEAQRNLAQVTASQAAARTSSLISRMDQPHGGMNPIGPSRATIVAVGALGGLMGGLGVLFLTVPFPMVPAAGFGAPAEYRTLTEHGYYPAPAELRASRSKTRRAARPRAANSSELIESNH